MNGLLNFSEHAKWNELKNDSFGTMSIRQKGCASYKSTIPLKITSLMIGKSDPHFTFDVNDGVQLIYDNDVIISKRLYYICILHECYMHNNHDIILLLVQCNLQFFCGMIPDS